jgi:fused signal recognition particle receptor
MGKFGELFARFSRAKITEEDLSNFRETLIDADFGRSFTDEIMRIAEKSSGQDLKERVISAIEDLLRSNLRSINISPNRLSTILVVGVNGTGKTTTVAKLANKFKLAGNKVTLAACDTFRAAAVDQLETWARRVGVSIVTGSEKVDPASVAFSAVERALRDNSDILIIDTAGRIHTKDNLMQELGKIERVVSKATPIDEILFVLDGTTGQNGIEQARAFKELTGLTGIVVTKLDGSAQGGIAIAVEHELDLPVKLIGTGERESDLKEFEPSAYLRELFT